MIEKNAYANASSLSYLISFNSSCIRGGTNLNRNSMVYETASFCKTAIYLRCASCNFTFKI